MMLQKCKGKIKDLKSICVRCIRRNNCLNIIRKKMRLSEMRLSKKDRPVEEKKGTGTAQAQHSIAQIKQIRKKNQNLQEVL
jgi:hypothetical protein